MLPPPQIAEAIDWLCETMIGYTEARIEFEEKETPWSWRKLQNYTVIKKEAKQELWRKIEKYGKK